MNGEEADMPFSVCAAPIIVALRRVANDRADPRSIVVFVSVEPRSPPAAVEGRNPRRGVGVGVGVCVCASLGSNMGERRREMGDEWTIKEERYYSIDAATTQHNPSTTSPCPSRSASFPSPGSDMGERRREMGDG